MKSQLALPGTLRRPAPPVARARRDFNVLEFSRALARNGFIQVGSVTFADLRGAKRRYIEAVYRVNPIRIARRATLAKLVRSRSLSE